MGKKKKKNENNASLHSSKCQNDQDNIKIQPGILLGVLFQRYLNWTTNAKSLKTKHKN